MPASVFRGVAKTRSAFIGARVLSVGKASQKALAESSLGVCIRFVAHQNDLSSFSVAVSRFAFVGHIRVVGHGCLMRKVRTTANADEKRGSSSYQAAGSHSRRELRTLH